MGGVGGAWVGVFGEEGEGVGGWGACGCGVTGLWITLSYRDCVVHSRWCWVFVLRLDESSATSA